MSKRKGIENLLGSAPAEVAPTATSLRSTPEAEPDQQHQKTAPQPSRQRKQKPNAEAIGVPTPIRFQVSAPEGGEIEMVLLEALEKIPASMRHSINIGALFRKVMIGNDAEIAAMLRKSLEGDGQ